MSDLFSVKGDAAKICSFMYNFVFINAKHKNCDYDADIVVK